MTKGKLVLVVEDDPRIARLLELSLKSQGYKVNRAETGAAGRMMMQSNNPDLILLDLGLPDCDGVELLRQIDEQEHAPVIVVTARDQVEQKVAALDAGANDYVVKPFDTDELFARIRVALRPSPRDLEEALPVYESGGLSIDFETHTIAVDGAEVHLTPNEYKLLKVLIENRGKAMTHRAIQREVWGMASASEDRTLRVLMNSLRRKLNERPSNARYIKTEVGVGYRFIG